MFDAVLPLLNTFARVPVCGRIATYNLTAPPPGPDQMPNVMGHVLVRRLTVRGFIVFDYADREPDFLRDVEDGFVTVRSNTERTSSKVSTTPSKRFKGSWRRGTSESSSFVCRTTRHAEPDTSASNQPWSPVLACPDF